MKRNRCRYCGVSDPAGLRFDRSYLGESNYICRDIDSCVERIKKIALKRTLPVPVLAEPPTASPVVAVAGGEARESTYCDASRRSDPKAKHDSRGGQTFAARKIGKPVQAIAVLSVLLIASTAWAAPYGINIPLPTEVVGVWNPCDDNYYSIRFLSPFGGQWSLVGHRNRHNNGTYTDAFNGTVSDTAIHGTFTQANFIWLGDSWYLENGSHGWITCQSFRITISAGNVSGNATFRP